MRDEDDGRCVPAAGGAEARGDGTSDGPTDRHTDREARGEQVNRKANRGNRQTGKLGKANVQRVHTTNLCGKRRREINTPEIKNYGGTSRPKIQVAKNFECVKLTNREIYRPTRKINRLEKGKRSFKTTSGPKDTARDNFQESSIPQDVFLLKNSPSYLSGKINHITSKTILSVETI